ncbi:MAG: DUF6701 domain-containing protein [Pseudomonadota bacterium]
MNTTIALWRTCLLLLLLALGGSAQASLNVTGITVNGNASASVAAGASVNIAVTVVATTRWNMVAITTNPPSSLNYCLLVSGAPGGTTYTKIFNVPAPSAQGTFAVRATAYPNPNCSAQQSNTYNLASGLTTGPAMATLDHVRIKHDGAGLICSPEPVTLQACANATCSTLYTGSVTVALGTTAGAWASSPVTFTNGSATVNLSNTNASTSVLSGTVTSPVISPPAAQCFKGSTSGDCNLVFSNASCSLDAVEAGQAPNTAIYTKRIGGTLSLDLLSLNNGVINTTSTAAINATLVAASGTGCSTTAVSNTVSVTLTGANLGRRNVTFTPNAAASNVRVRMTSGSLIGCSSDNFAIRPGGLTLSASGVKVDAVGTDATATPVRKAGADPFSMSAVSGAIGYNGVLKINQDRLQTSNTYVGTVAGAFGAADAANGTATGNAFTYSDVGYFKLNSYAVYDDAFADVDQAKSPSDCVPYTTLGSEDVPVDPNLVVGGKIGCYFGNALATSYYGRFIPDHFALSSASIQNRSAIPACSASTFNYVGDPFMVKLTLTAQNGAGDTTSNYTDSFARLDLANKLGVALINVAPSTGTRTKILKCVNGSEVSPCFKLGAVTAGAVTAAFASGEVTDMVLPLTVFRGAAAFGPFDGVKVGLAPEESDLVKMATYDIDTDNLTAGANNHALAASTIVRYGRMGIDNAYGSELLNLTMKLNAQYWTGAAYATNTLDSCTVPTFAAFLPADYLVGGINASNMPSSKLVAGPALVNGAGQLMLTKPSPAPSSKGAVIVRSNVSNLPGSARATFGVYKAGPVIYVRETY